MRLRITPFVQVKYSNPNYNNDYMVLVSREEHSINDIKITKSFLIEHANCAYYGYLEQKFGVNVAMMFLSHQDWQVDRKAETVKTETHYGGMIIEVMVDFEIEKI